MGVHVIVLQPPLLHVFVFMVALAGAYGSRRALRGAKWEALPVLVGLGAAGACLLGARLLWAQLAFALGGSSLLLLAWFFAAQRVAFLRRLNWLILLGCCLWVAGSGVSVDMVKVPLAQKFVSLGRLALPLTVLWLWVVTYLIASPAQAEETATGLCFLISAVFLAISALQADFMGPLPAGLSTGALGCCLGVALGSRSRLTPRVGAAGRGMLGLMLATISVLGALKNTAFLVLVVPFLALALPLVEVTYVLFSARRLGEEDVAHGFSPAQPPPQADLKVCATTHAVGGEAAVSPARSVAVSRGRDSLNGYLMGLGLSQEQAAVLFYLATAFLGAVAVLLVLLIEVHFAVKLLLLALFLPGGFLVFFVAHKMLARVGEERGMVELFGVPIANLTGQEALERIAEFVSSRRPHHVVTSDSLMLVRAQRDEEFRQILERADLVTPDGAGVIWAGRMLGQRLREKVSGVDLVERICGIAAERGFSVYLLGGSPGVAEEAARVLAQRHPGLKVAGTRHGYFCAGEEGEIVEGIAAVRPEVLFVGLGAPRQEKWITANLNRLGVPVCIGVGGSFDVISGRLARAPVWMQRWGLEWLYRVMKEPKRLPKLFGLPRFVLMTLRSLRGGGAKRGRN